MTPPARNLDAVNRRATTLLAHGLHAAAANQTLRVLERLDPDTAAPDERLITTVGLYLQGVAPHDLDDNDTPLKWARYAVRVSKDRNGLAHPDTIEALHHLLWALCMSCTDTWQTGPGAGIAAVWTWLLRATTVLHGLDATETLHCRYERAMALHQHGHCEPATQELMRTWVRWQRCYGTADTTILRGLAEVLHACPDDVAAIWLRTQLLAVPAGDLTAIHNLLHVGSTPARAAAHQPVCTRGQPPHTVPVDPAAQPLMTPYHHRT